MTDQTERVENRFVEYLLQLSKNQDRGVLAVLRRGLTLPPAVDVNMYPYVARFVPDKERGTAREKVYYLVAALYAYHPMDTPEGDFGQHMRAAAGDKAIEATERRFVALLNAHVDDLPDALRQAVSYLKSKDIAVNWKRLFTHLTHWDHPDRYVQRGWANSFWGFTPAGELARTNQKSSGGNHVN